ncbi:MAG: hypothetical protein LH613_18635 [Chamaesiphon sp.]|nr:hypothetical protein [Chamaesiphon sp.]
MSDLIPLEVATRLALEYFGVYSLTLTSGRIDRSEFDPDPRLFTIEGQALGKA